MGAGELDLEAGGHVSPYDSSLKAGPSITASDVDAHIDEQASIRLGFLRKVYSLLATQLAITTLTSCLFLFSGGIRFWVVHHIGVLMVFMVLSFVLLFPLFKKRHESPQNLYWLLAFTLAQSYVVGYICTHYEAQLVVQAFVLTLAVTVGLTLFTFQTRVNMDGMGSYLFAGLMVVIFGSFLQIFIPMPAFSFVLSLASALLFSLYIVYDTWQIMHRMSTEDYVVATTELYLDVINLFLSLLRILDALQKN